MPPHTLPFHSNPWPPPISRLPNKWTDLSQSRKIAANYAELSTGVRPKTTTTKTRKKKKKRRVRDVIPESRLACYGDFEYEDDDDELLLLLEISAQDGGGAGGGGGKGEEKTLSNGELAAKSREKDEITAREQPWMLDEVEEHLARITAVKRRRPGHEPLVGTAAGGRHYVA